MNGWLMKKGHGYGADMKRSTMKAVGDDMRLGGEWKQGNNTWHGVWVAGWLAGPSLED
jgi:hypothetical protein